MEQVDTCGFYCFTSYMPSRKVPFVNGEYYHIYNRGVAKMRIFHNTHDFHRFLRTIQYYMVDGPKPKFSFFTPSTFVLNQTNKIVEIIAYCLMPNHFHFALRQIKEGGITEFVSKISNSYTKYFNVKDDRVGPLLQGEFQSVHIETNEQLIHVTRYVHLNPTVNFISKTLDDYPWSSFHEYTNEVTNGFCEKEIILNQFPSKKAYKEFVLNQEDYGKTLEAIKHQLLDFEE